MTNLQTTRHLPPFEAFAAFLELICDDDWDRIWAPETAATCDLGCETYSRFCPACNPDRDRD